MKPSRIIAAVALACTPAAAHGADRGFRLSKTHDAFLIEDDIVYARCLFLGRDGTYRQINRDEHGSEEVDRGTWEQSAGGILRLRATRHALRFHALAAGSLTVGLASEAQRAALPALSDDVAGFLAASEDAVFSAGDVAGLVTRGTDGVEPCRLDVAGGTATCSRQDLEALARQIAHFLRTESSGVYVLTPTRTAGGPPVFVLADDTFQAGDLPRVRREYRVATGGRPPFYFVPVEARVFAREAGSWRQPRMPGSPE